MQQELCMWREKSWEVVKKTKFPFDYHLGLAYSILDSINSNPHAILNYSGILLWDTLLLILPWRASVSAQTIVLDSPGWEIVPSILASHSLELCNSTASNKKTKEISPKEFKYKERAKGNK